MMMMCELPGTVKRDGERGEASGVSGHGSISAASLVASNGSLLHRYCSR